MKGLNKIRREKEIEGKRKEKKNGASLLGKPNRILVILLLVLPELTNKNTLNLNPK